MYKLPKLKKHPDSKIAHGIAYAFITPETISQGWQLSEKTVMDPESFIGRSVSYLYSAENEMQNDVDVRLLRLRLMKGSLENEIFHR